MHFIVDDTVRYYSGDPYIRRSRHNPTGLETGWGCYYLGPDGTKCAIGRLLDDRMMCTICKDELFICSALASLLRSIPVKERYAETEHFFKDQAYDQLSYAFFYRLQRFHDADTNWDGEKSSLSSLGELHLATFEGEIDTGGYDLAEYRPSIQHLIRHSYER